jgi:hypothetical protein
MKRLKYTTLFDYAVKEWRLSWSECHRIFFKTNAINFNGTSDDFYHEDLVDEIDNICFPPMWGKDYGKAMDIIRSFMVKNGYMGVKFYS